MKPFQEKYFNGGKQMVLDDLKNSRQINPDAFIDLLNDLLKASGEMTYQTVQRDSNNEMIGTTSEKIQIADTLAYNLSGRICALVAFTNATLTAGVKFNPD